MRRRADRRVLSDQPLAEQLRAAIGRAASVVDSGAAARALDGWVSNSQELPPASRLSVSLRGRAIVRVVYTEREGRVEVVLE